MEPPVWLQIPREEKRKSLLKSHYLKQIHFTEAFVFRSKPVDKSKLYICGFLGGSCRLTSKHHFLLRYSFVSYPWTQRGLWTVSISRLYQLTSLKSQRPNFSFVVKSIPMISFLPRYLTRKLGYKISSGTSVKRCVICNKFVYHSEFFSVYNHNQVCAFPKIAEQDVCSGGLWRPPLAQLQAVIRFIAAAVIERNIEYTSLHKV